MLLKMFSIANLKADKNNRNVIVNIGLSLIVKGGSLVVTVLTMPSYMRYFDNKSILGVWFTVLSILSWVLSFDFGIGNGLRNQLVPALVRKDIAEQKKLISSGYISLSALSLLILLIFIIFAPLANWNAVFNIEKRLISPDLLEQMVIICVLGIILQFTLKLVSSILFALQYAFLPNLLGLLSTTSLLLFVNISICCGHKNDIILLAWANVFSVNIPLLVATIAVFLTKLRHVIPSIKYFDVKYSADIVKFGFAFLWLQLMALVINSTNDFLITLLIAPSQDVTYQAYSKIFTLVSGVVTLALVPLWSAVTKAKVEKRYGWIKNVYVLILLLNFIVFVIYLLLVPFLQSVFNIWLGSNTIAVNYVYAFIFVIFGTVNIWSGSLATLVNGLGELKTQIIFLSFGAAINIPCAYLLAHTYGGFISIVIANIISILPFCIVQTFVLFSSLNRKIRIMEM